MSTFQQFPNISLFLGGARSGKSYLAEQHCIFSTLDAIYFATARPDDAEMKIRIESHQQRRGNNWQTKELPLDLTGALAVVKPTEVVLIDCLTLWLSNMMLAKSDLGSEQAKLLTALQSCSGKVVCVSSELGMGLVPQSKLGRDFRDAQGTLNQSIAEIAELVIFVAAGLPLTLKGNLPEAKNDP